MTWVKICGITSVRDAELAVASGADALGFNFYSGSPRCMDPAKALRIIEALPETTEIVGIFVNAEERYVRDILATVPLDVLQFHGHESFSYCAQFHLPFYRAFPVKSAHDLAAIRLFMSNPGAPKRFLLDAKVEGVYGGSGQTFDWKLSERVQDCGHMILSGGLNPENIAEAVKTVRPYGVDVASGVESKPGEKDAEKLRAFLSIVRNNP